MNHCVLAAALVVPLLRLLEGDHRLLPGHAGEVGEELVEGVAGLEVVEKRLERNAGPHEDRGASQDFGVAVDHGGRTASAKAPIPGSVRLRCELFTSMPTSFFPARTTKSTSLFPSRQ